MRSYNRFSTDTEIKCRIEGELIRASLYNLSCGGCMIETKSDLAREGAEIDVRLNAKVIMPGKIVWRIDKNAGIKFSLPLHQKVVERFGYDGEDFDSNDPRDRFGIPIVDFPDMAAGMIEN